MATYRFTGATSGVLSVAGNWSPAGPPVNGDTAIFDNVSVDVTAGLVATALAKLYATPRFTGKWGASGAPIEGVGVTNLIWEASSEEVWFGSAAIVRAKIAPRSVGANAVNFVGSSLGHMRCVTGQINIGATCTMGALLVLQPSPEGAFIGPEVIVTSGATWSTGQRAIVHGGRLQLYCGPTGALTDDFVQVAGGEIWMRAGTIDNVYVSGGTFRHDAGTVTAATLTEGRWDATRGAEARTLTTLYQLGGESDFRNSAAEGKPGTFVYLGGETSLPEDSYAI